MANYVTLQFTAQDAGQGAEAGSVSIVPTSVVVDAGVTVVSQDPVVRQFSGGTVSVQLFACDNTGTTPAAGFWAYNITLPGWTAPKPYLVNFSNGATQRFDNLTPAVASVTYGPAAGSGGFANPMSALGDIIYEDATPTAVRLPGSTSATKKFLTQTGNGSVSAAPGWNAIAAADLAATANELGYAPLVLNPDGSVSWGKPWQFPVEAYGAKGDGKVITDLVLSSNTTATSATAAFTSADTGKTIMINGGAGTANTPLVTTITFVNATTITLGSGAAVSGTAFQAVYGTDDTAAIQSAVMAAGNYATAHGYFAEVLFAAKIYMLASGPTQAGNGSSTPTSNAQLTLPWPNPNGTTQKLVIALTGAGDAGHVEYWESLTPNVVGTALVSTISAPSTPNATFGIQSVIGGPSGSAGFTGSFANVKAVIKGIQVVCGTYTNSYAFDFGYLAAMRVQQSGALIFAPSGVNGGNSPLLKDLPAQVAFQSTIGSGLRTPVIGNNADVVVDDFTVEGFARALYIFDHFTAGRIFTFYNDVACKIDLTQGVGNTSHGIAAVLWGAEAYNGGISVAGGSGICAVYINWDAEVPSPAYDVSDPNGLLRGVVHWLDPVNNRAPIVTGAGALCVVNDRLGPGAWSGQPAVPASTTPQQNTSWRDAAVSIKGGTVTVIAVDGVTVATATGTTVIVPAGKNITLTYSVAPTWAWTLM